MKLPCEHFLVLPYKNFPAAYSSSQAVELQPWEFVNLLLFARQQRGTASCSNAASPAFGLSISNAASS